MSNLKSVTEASFDVDVATNSLPVLVDFWAEWCGPCKALAPSLEKVSETFKGTVDFVKVNVDEHPSVRDRFGVKGIPTLILLRGGEEIGRVVGNRSATQLAGFLDTHLGTVTEVARAVITLSAFGGDPGIKAGQKKRLHDYLERKQAAPNEDMWEGDIGNALQFVAGTADVDDCARALGMPTDVMSVVEALSSYDATNMDAARYIEKWLDSVPVGADLSTLPAQLIVGMLKSRIVSDLLGDDSTLRDRCDELGSLHAAESNDPSSAAVDWAATRTRCLQIGSAAADQNRGLLAGMLATACTSLIKEPDMLTEFIFAVAQYDWKRLQLECNWTSADDSRIPQLADEIARRAVEQGGIPPVGEAMMKKIEDIDPDLASRYRYHYDDGMRALGAKGRRIGELLIDLTKRCK